MTVSLRLSPAESVMFKNYAKIQGTSLSEVLRKALREKIEDELDLKDIREYETEKQNGNLELLDSEEVWAKLGV